VKSKFNFGLDLANNEVEEAVWVNFLDEGSKQREFGMQKKGVSVKKVVVSL